MKPAAPSESHNPPCPGGAGFGEQPPSAPDIVLNLAAMNGGSIDARKLCLAGCLFGYSVNTMRVAITRLNADWRLTRVGHGHYILDAAQNTQWLDLKRWVDEAMQLRRWSGNWIAVHDGGITRSDRPLWRLHSNALLSRGFRMLQAGLHVRPDNRSGGVEIERIRLSDRGLARSAKVFCMHALCKQDDDLARSLWKADGIPQRLLRCKQQLTEHSGLVSASDAGAALRHWLMGLLGTAGVLTNNPLLPLEMADGADSTELVPLASQFLALGDSVWRHWTQSVQAEQISTFDA